MAHCVHNTAILRNTTGELSPNAFLDDSASGALTSTSNGARFAAARSIVQDSIFDSNEAVTGAAVAHLIGELDINNVTFSNNEAAVAGGAIVNLNAGLFFGRFSPVKMTISASTFENNGCDGDRSGFFNQIFPDCGGAIFNAFGFNPVVSTTLLVDDATFIGNVASSGGGAIANGLEGGVSLFGGGGSGGILRVTDSDFTGNSAERGGAIANAGTGEIELLIDSEFEENQASRDGGALWNRATIGVMESEESVLRDVELETNCAGGNGGGLYNAGDIFSIISVEVEENHAANRGGGLFNIGLIGLLEDSEFEENSALVADPALANAGTIADSVDNEFEDNVPGGSCLIGVDN